MTDGTTTWNYTYNADGLRTTRSNGTATYKYVYNGSSLTQMTVGNDTLYFTDATVTYNNTVYYYVKNIQGDVIAILDTNGTAVVEYAYDAWGNILSTTGSMASTLGQINPLRYRSYVYDHETGLYYLQSRYYDPEVGRFLNADVFTSTGQGILGNNMFAYCGNNPVAYSDSTGNKPEYCGDPEYEWMYDFGWWLKEQTERDKAAIKSGEVSYESRGAGKGAHIENSHKIKTPWVMFEFVKENRGDDIAGSTLGVVYEWVFHNIAYEIGSVFSIDSITIPAASLDVGKTIYDDMRALFTVKWFMSEYMKQSYSVMFPGIAGIDYLIGEWWVFRNGI